MVYIGVYVMSICIGSSVFVLLVLIVVVVVVGMVTVVVLGMRYIGVGLCRWRSEFNVQ